MAPESENVGKQARLIQENISTQNPQASFVKDPSELKGSNDFFIGYAEYLVPGLPQEQAFRWTRYVVDGAGNFWYPEKDGQFMSRPDWLGVRYVKVPTGISPNLEVIYGVSYVRGNWVLTVWDRQSGKAVGFLDHQAQSFESVEATSEAIIPLPDFSLDLLGTVNEEGVSLTIPFTVGLMKDIRERPDEPIKEIMLNPERPDASDKLAYYYLRICWLNHKKNYPEHADISWTEYLGEVQAGRGLIKLALADPSTSSWDSPKKTVWSAKEISPLDGITVIEADSLFGMKKLGGLYAVEENGRLITVAHRLFPESLAQTPDKIQKDAGFTAGGILSDIYIVLGADINQALKSGYVGDVFNSLDPDFYNEYLDLIGDFYNFSNESLSKPYFIIEQ